MTDLSMQGNRHYAWASDALETEAQAEGSYLTPQDVALRTAQVEATLALAFEQRTANLIALEALLERFGSDVELDAIQERLGLNV